ncbi:hypothetical protein BJ165DRAFT_1416599 [Panaeolus papilionaceus]|nr:hypothetical protein BJ165DRAFT_1416599 [Panaeolus papilionaceus]
MVHTRANSDTEEDRDDDGLIFKSSIGASSSTWSNKPNYYQGSSSQSLRTRLFGLSSSSNLRSHTRDRPICTTPGQVCAGETETETDEPSRHLPTARKIPSSAPLVPPNTLQQRFTPLLFEFSRLLSIVPALIGTIYYLYFLYHPPEKGINWDDPIRPPPERIDYFVTVLWCLALTTGLLTRWRLYYAPLSTLVRLLALQGICWPATSLTLSFFDHDKRPVATWAAIATTTSISRSVQIWVTSNLWWGGRRWDWKAVGVKCILPVGVLYFVTAWAELLRREMEMARLGAKRPL